MEVVDEEPGAGDTCGRPSRGQKKKKASQKGQGMIRKTKVVSGMSRTRKSQSISLVVYDQDLSANMAYK